MKNFRHILTFVTGACLVAAVVFGPLAFGAVEPWAYSVLALLAFTALAAALVHDAVSGRGGAAFSPLAFIGIAALILAAIQIAPWPVALLGGVQPGSLAPREMAASVLGGVIPEYIAPSLYPHATYVSLIKLGAYVALFMAACSYISSRRRLHRLAVAITAAGFVASLVGILQSLSGARDIFWLRQIHSGAIFGPFVSRNQFAAYAGLALFTGLGLLLARGGYSPAIFRRVGRGKLPPARPSQNLLLGFAVSIMGAAVIWSLSRGGIISAFLAGAAVVAALIAARYSSGKRIYVGAVLLVALGFVTWFGWQPVMDRLATLGVVVDDPLSIDQSRAAMWGDAWRMGLSFPLIGSGAGTFFSVYPSFRTLPVDMVTRSPHNEYLGALAEAGFAGLLLMLLALVFMLARVFRALRVRQDPYTLEFLAGGVGGVFMIAFHSVVDFPLRSPGIAATLAVSCAMLYKLAVLDRKKPRSASAPGESGDNSEPARMSAKQGPDKTGVLVEPTRGAIALNGLISMVILIGWLLACNAALGEMHGQIDGARINRAADRLTPDTGNVRGFIEASHSSMLSHSPGNAALRASLADFAGKASAILENPLERMALAEKALELREEAVRLEPANAEHRYHLAAGYLAMGRVDYAWANARLAADLLPRDPWIRADLAEMFFRAGLRHPAVEMLEEAASLAGERNMDAALKRIERLQARRGERGAAQ